MIQTTPNPKMTHEEVERFRTEYRKCVLKEMTAEEKAAVQKRQARMKATYLKIIRNNVGKTRFSDIEITIEKLKVTDSQELSLFSCGEKDLDNVFHNELLICSKYHYLAAYCAKEVTSKEIVAIFTLANDTVILNSPEDKEEFLLQSLGKINDEYIPIFQQQTSFPAINIGHLGVRKDLQGKNIDEQVLDFILETFTSFELAGCQYITVDSLNNSRTNKFYARNGFLFQTDTDMQKSTRRMYLPIELYRTDSES